MSNVRSYTDNQLLNKVKQLPSFNGYPKDFWILGVRSNEDQPNRFDDKFYLFRGEQFVEVMTGTTNPGLTILGGGFREYNKAGAAVVKSEEWYYDLWRFGKHRGKMEALLQIGSKIKYFRDGNLNGKSEEIGLLMEGFIGINFHANTYDFTSKVKKENINDWSAGCQVANDNQKYLKFIDHCKRQKNVTYCLINEF